MRGFNAFYNDVIKQETVMGRQTYIGITCPFCNGIRYIYNLTADEVLTYKHEECPLREVRIRNERISIRTLDNPFCIIHVWNGLFERLFDWKEWLIGRENRSEI